MPNSTCYLNTDLTLLATEDLTALAAALAHGGAPPLHVTRLEDGLWLAICETSVQFDEPEQTIDAILTAIERLPTALQQTWSACHERTFDIGYDCGENPPALEQDLSTALLGRIVAVGGALRITLYGAAKL